MTDERPPRRALRVVDGRVEVGHEVRFDSEQQLHRAISDHPEVLPSEDIGMGPLVRLAEELDLGHGPLDLLAVDPAGRLVIVEFKRGTENPDVRKVIAQLLDYGSRLWRLPYEILERHSLEQAVPADGPPGDLAELVGRRLGLLGHPDFDPVMFRDGVARHLEAGDFVYLYVARDLDSRTRAVMTYLADGARLAFFAVEVDRFRHDDGSSMLVPRTAFTPAWAAVPTASKATPASSFLEDLKTSPPALQELVAHLEALASSVGAVVADKAKGRHVRPAAGKPGVSVYTSDKKLWLDLTLLKAHQPQVAEAIVVEIRALTGRKITRVYPSLPCEEALRLWPQLEPVLTRYLDAQKGVLTERDAE